MSDYRPRRGICCLLLLLLLPCSAKAQSPGALPADGQVDAAIALDRATLEKQPNNSATLDYKAALSEFQEAHRLDPRLPVPRDNSSH